MWMRGIESRCPRRITGVAAKLLLQLQQQQFQMEIQRDEK